MQYILSVVIILSALIKKKSKLITVCMIIFFCILMGLNIHHISNSGYYNMDFTNYYTLYQGNQTQISGRDIEVGFQFLMLLSNKIGLSYNMFRVLISIIGYTLITVTLKRYTPYTNLIYILYFIFPFLNDAIQIRNFLSMSIIIYSIRYIIEDKKFNSIKYIFGIFLASTIHISSLFYILFLPIKKVNRKILFGVTTYFAVILVALAYTDFYLYLVGIITENDRILRYFDRRTTWGLILVFGILIMFYLTFYVMYKRCRTDTDSLIDTKFMNLLLKMNIIMLSIAPLLVYDFNFIRMYRNILPLNYIVFVHAILSTKNDRKSKILYSFIAVFFVLCLFIIFYAFNADTQIWPIFKDNMLF
ncbi:EpsG family protein [Clostridium culturomicium]|uniref:EpsG family protein n=1 Tax=Clostridium culturomicium TaxID=1499683 RepID=UPI00058FF949|nr:EpsG family protein [Clostridium culturomicium]